MSRQEHHPCQAGGANCGAISDALGASVHEPAINIDTIHHLDASQAQCDPDIECSSAETPVAPLLQNGEHEQDGKFGVRCAKMNAFNVHVAKVEKRLKHWTAELDKVAGRALSIEVSEKAEFESRFVDLQAKLDFARSKLEALRCAGEHKWEAFKDDLEVSIRRLEKSFKK